VSNSFFVSSFYPFLSDCLDNVMLEVHDLQSALNETFPAFGAKTTELQGIYRNGFVQTISPFNVIIQNIQQSFSQLANSERTSLLTCLLSGAPGCGKSSIVARMAVESGFPFIRIVSPEDLIGISDASKCAHIMKVFQDSYKSDKSIVILDDLERMIDYVAIGPRFSTMAIQTLLVLLRKAPVLEGRKLMVLATTSMAMELEDLQITQSFDLHFKVPKLQQVEEIRAVVDDLGPEVGNFDEIVDGVMSQLPVTGIPIKKLIFLIERAKMGGDEIDIANLLANLSVLDL